MKTKVELAEADIQEAIEEYLKRRGFVPCNVSLTPHFNNEDCGGSNYVTASAEVETLESRLRIEK